MRFPFFSNRRHVVVTCLVILFAGYLCLLRYVFLHHNEWDAVEEAVLINAPSDRTYAPTVNAPRLAPSSLRRTGSVPVPVSHYQAPVSRFQSTAPAGTIHTSSSAQIHHIGGGGSTGGTFTGTTTTVSNNIVSSPISVSTSVYVLPTLARVSSRNLNAETTRRAEQDVVDKNGPERRVTNRRNDEWDDYGQDPEPFPDEVPVGAPWVMLLLAGGYMIKKYRKA